MQEPILREIPMPIVTPRLLIRPAQPGDGAAVHKGVSESLPELREFLDWAKEEPTVDGSEANARRSYAKWITREDLRMLMFDRATEEFVGSAGLHRMVWGVPSFEIGYWLATKFAGRGLMTEAVVGLTRYAFAVLGAKRVTIHCDRDNTRSQKIPQKLGFVHEGTLQNQGLKPNGGLRSMLIFARYAADGLPEFAGSGQGVEEVITSAQLEQVVPLFDAYRQFYGKASDVAGARAFLEKRLSEKSGAIFLAQKDGVGVGFTQLYRSFSSVSMRETFILNDLFVRADSRRDGVARALMDFATTYAQKRGALGLSLETAVSNLPAQGLYDSLGWIKDTEYFHYHRNCSELPK